MSNKDKDKHQPVEHAQKPGEIYMLTLLLILFCLFLYEALKNKGILQGLISGPGTIAQLIILGTIAMIIALFVKIIKSNYNEGKFSELINALFNKNLIVIIIAVILYSIILEKIGFVITSGLFLFLAMVALEPKEIFKKFIISTGTLAAIVIIFKYLFQVVLP